MPENWKSYKLGDITSWSSGGTPKKDKAEYWNGDIPWISANSMHTNRLEKSDLSISELGLKTGSKLASKNSILLLVRGGALHNRIPVGIALRDVAFNQDVKAIKANEKIVNPWYLLSWFIANTPTLSALVEFTGIGAGKLDTARLQNLIVDLPSLDEQENILCLAKAIDDKIELNLEMNRTQERIAQTIFKHWFVDFQFPGFDGEVVDGLPKDWRIGKLGEVLELAYGKALKSETRVEGKYPVIGSSGVVGCHNEFYVEGAGIVIGRKGTIGEVIWIDENFFPIDTTFFVKDLLGVNDLFFHFYLLQKQNFKSIASDSAVPGLNRNQAMQNEIIIPDKKVILQFNEIIKPIFEKKSLLKNENQILTQIRNGLLPKLMSGKIRVSE